jgi:hypothetical protein
MGLRADSRRGWGNRYGVGDYDLDANQRCNDGSAITRALLGGVVKRHPAGSPISSGAAEHGFHHQGCKLQTPGWFQDMIDAKQQQMDFMEAQALAMDMIRLTAGRKIGVISHTYALMLSTFATTIEGVDPHDVIAKITDTAHFHADQQHIKPGMNS